jgi:hypothetical protein
MRDTQRRVALGEGRTSLPSSDLRHWTRAGTFWGAENGSARFWRYLFLSPLVVKHFAMLVWHELIWGFLYGLWGFLIVSVASGSPKSSSPVPVVKSLGVLDRGLNGASDSLPDCGRRTRTFSSRKIRKEFSAWWFRGHSNHSGPVEFCKWWAGSIGMVIHVLCGAWLSNCNRLSPTVTKKKFQTKMIRHNKNDNRNFDVI